MAIKKIKISNFKSFDKLEVELRNFNLLIGANASGKSNFIQVFKCLRDITKHGLENAISMQGGIEYLRNLNIGSSEDFSVEVVSDVSDSFTLSVSLPSAPKKGVGLEGLETTYKFALKFRESGARFEIAEDELSQRCNFYNYTRRRGKLLKEEALGQGEIILSRIKGRTKLVLNPPEGVKVDQNDIFEIYATSQYFKGKVLKPKTLLMEGPHLFFVGRTLRSSFENISIYDFDPKSPKKAQKITGRAELEEDGSNLAITLKNIMRSGNSKRKLLNLLHEVLPFVNDLGTETFADKSLMFKLREEYSGKRFLPASLMSDGTINLTALIIALYFEENPLIIIEEPERNIHPHLISKVIGMMKEASHKKQIIATTHNPEMVKHVDLNDILLISRDKNGFSRISRPAEKEEIRAFLKDEIGIEELYVRNLLEM